MTKAKFIAHYFLLNKNSYLLATFCIFVVNWLQVEIPRYIKFSIDLLGDAAESARSELTTNISIVIVFSVAMVGVRILSRMYALNPGRITEAALKNDLLYKLNRLPNDFHSKFSSGKLISIINNDINGIRAFYGVGFLQSVNVIFALSLTPIWMWRISPELTLYSVIPVLVAFVFFSYGFNKMRIMQQERMLQLQSLSEQLMNYLSGIDLIKNQQMGAWVIEEVKSVNQQLLSTVMKITRIQTFILPLLDYANDLMKVIILGFGGYILLQQELTLGELTAFLSYSALLALPLMQLGRIAVIYQMGLVSIESVQTILNSDIPEQDVVSFDALKKTASLPEVLTVKNLSFQYPNSAKPVLTDISFTINPGDKVGVLGQIGSGKSTLVNCINHHLSIEPGHIYWGDNDITSMPRQKWRASVRTITQDPYLFSDTIEQNVRFGSAEAMYEKADINAVLALSQLDEDIARFGQQQQTVVGEKGIMLSGGQKQRLSIARAILNPSHLMILDNVLSAVDYETERKILKGLLHRIKHQSILVVSHRVSALEAMDLILVLKDGKIIAQGDHSSLMKTSKYYQETWELQQHEVEAVS